MLSEFSRHIDWNRESNWTGWAKPSPLLSLCLFFFFERAFLTCHIRFSGNSKWKHRKTDSCGCYQKVTHAELFFQASFSVVCFFVCFFHGEYLNNVFQDAETNGATSALDKDLEMRDRSAWPFSWQTTKPKQKPHSWSQIFQMIRNTRPTHWRGLCF